MRDADATPGEPGQPGESPEPRELVVQVAAGGGEGEYMLVLHRPADGRVFVREWGDANWASSGTDRVLPVADVYGRVRRAYDQRRRVSVELARLRAWLDGRG